jgi:hypothetical protein
LAVLHRIAAAPPAQLAAAALRPRPATAAVAAEACALPLSTSGTGIIVDSGFSFTHVVPLHNWRVVPSGVRRLDVGGKLLTNYMKELISYRQWNMMEDTAVVNTIKERLCFVAADFDLEMEIAKRLSAPAVLARARAAASTASAAVRASGPASPSASAATAAAAAAAKSGRTHARARPTDDGVGVGIRREYVLPDFVTVMRGYVRGSDEDPELYMQPSEALAASTVAATPAPPASSGPARDAARDAAMDVDSDGGDAAVDTRPVGAGESKAPEGTASGRRDDSGSGKSRGKSQRQHAGGAGKKGKHKTGTAPRTKAAAQSVGEEDGDDTGACGRCGVFRACLARAASPPASRVRLRHAAAHCPGPT